MSTYLLVCSFLRLVDSGVVETSTYQLSFSPRDPSAECLRQAVLEDASCDSQCIDWDSVTAHGYVKAVRK